MRIVAPCSGNSRVVAPACECTAAVRDLPHRQTTPRLLAWHHPCSPPFRRRGSRQRVSARRDGKGSPWDWDDDDRPRRANGSSRSSDSADGSNDAGNPWRPSGRYSGSGAWQEGTNDAEWDKWEASWSEDLVDDSWADTTPDTGRPRGVPGRRIDPIRGPRDAYLRPMIDAVGIRQRLAFKSQVGEEELRSEFEVNLNESRQAVSFAAFLFLVPLVAGFCFSRLVAEPVFVVMQERSPLAFAPSEQQKVEGAEMVHKEELRIQMDVAIGRAPPLSDAQMQQRLRHEARELLQEFREDNKRKLLNVISDSVTGALLFAILLLNTDGRRVLFRTIGRVFGGLSDTAKAFLIIASTDILLGYHSEEGWTAAIRLILGHYGAEVEEDASHIFVAIVPVVLDSIFKYWIFVGLNRRDPAATVTLKSMDRH